MKKEILYSVEYDNDLCSTYLVEKNITEQNISIIVYDTWNGRHKEMS